MKYHIIIFGCQMNISDAERIASVLESMRYKSTDDINSADLIVVTMCSVRQSAVDRIHGLIEKFKIIKKSNPKLKTILTGCIIKKDKPKFEKGFDYLVDIKDIKKIPGILNSSLRVAGREKFLRSRISRPGRAYTFKAVAERNI
jgi:tRNA-2-methylthio-N6-dimethylallyladenosine synthase